MEFSEFLSYAAGPGVNAVVGFVLSFLVGMWPAYKDQSARMKRYAFMIPLCFLVPVVATALGVFTQDWPGQWDPTWWNAVVAGFTAAFAGTLTHGRTLSAQPKGRL